MRLRQVLFFFSGILLCTAVAIPTQQETLAEQQFKNIKSFKGQKATDVLPAMKFMCASLKVNCDYCHTEDRASDAKPEKQTAREMIAMQRDINARHFNGRTVVTCATCHGGKTNPINVPPVKGVEVRARRSGDVKATDVLAAYGKAVGTPAAGVQAWRLQGKSKMFGQDVTLDALYAPGKYVIASKSAQGVIRQGHDGKATWYAPGKGVSTIPQEVATSFVRQNVLFFGPSSLPGLTNPTGATAKIDGRDMLAVTGTVAGETGRGTYYFDKQTGLLARTVFSFPTSLGSNVVINDFAGYKRVGGVMVPMKIASHTGDRDTEITFSSAKAESKVDTGAFAPPAS